MTDISEIAAARDYRVPEPPAHLIDRPRLTARILNVSPGRVCLLFGPHGYGATTAAVLAISHSEDQIRWLGLSPAWTPAVRWERIARWIADASGTEPAATPQTFDAAEVARGLAAGPAHWLVLDGLGSEQQAVWQALLPLARALPTTVRLILVSSRRPPHSWIELAGGPGGALLTGQDLACTPEEAMDLLRGWAPAIPLDLLASLSRDADGWTAALALAGASARHGGIDAGWLAAAGADMLFADRLGALPGHLRDFLIETAVLEELSPDLAAAVSGRDDAGELILELEQQQYYLSEVPAAEGYQGTRWWVRHPLLTAALRHRLRPDAGQRHSAAADWFLAVDDLDGTMRHLLASGRIADAAGYLAEHESGLLSLGLVGKVAAWYDRISVERGEAQLVTLLRKAWGSGLAGDPVRAQALLARIEANVRVHEPFEPPVPRSEVYPDWVGGQVALLQAYIAGYRGDPATMVAAAQRAVAALGAASEHESAQLAPILLGLGHLWSEDPQAARGVLEGLRDQPFPNDMMRECQLAGLTALVAVAHGEVREARALVLGTQRWLARQELRPAELLQFPYLLASAAVHLGFVELDEAEAAARQLLAAVEPRHDVGYQTAAVQILARVAAARGDNGSALRALGNARSLLVEATPRSAMLVGLDLALARIRLDAGDPLRAARLAHALPPGERRTLLWARIAMRRQPASAKRALDSLTPATVGAAAERHLLLAAVHERTSRRLARAHVQRAAELACTNGIGMLLVGADQGLVDLATEGALEAQSDELNWVLERRAAALEPGEGRPPAAAAGPAMSRGELQLIGLLPSRASNAELAASLGVSVNTVKTRLRRLYAKLGAKDRNDAIRRAQERGLLPPT